MSKLTYKTGRYSRGRGGRGRSAGFVFRRAWRATRRRGSARPARPTREPGAGGEGPGPPPGVNRESSSRWSGPRSNRGRALRATGGRPALAGLTAVPGCGPVGLTKLVGWTTSWPSYQRANVFFEAGDPARCGAPASSRILAAEPGQHRGAAVAGPGLLPLRPGWVRARGASCSGWSSTTRPTHYGPLSCWGRTPGKRLRPARPRRCRTCGWRTVMQSERGVRGRRLHRVAAKGPSDRGASR